MSIKKCGVENCDICLPVKMDKDTFKSLNLIPDPTPTEDGLHYKPFSELYGSDTTEDHRPSTKKTTSRGTSTFPFTMYHVTNADTVICCEECDMWRVIYSKRKLGPNEKEALRTLLDADTFAYTCGQVFDDVQLPAAMDGHIIGIKGHSCSDVVETLYYTNSSNDLICVYCACLLPEIVWEVKTALVYPKCADCADKADIKLKKRKQPAS